MNIFICDMVYMPDFNGHSCTILAVQPLVLYKDVVHDDIVYAYKFSRDVIFADDQNLGFSWFHF